MDALADILKTIRLNTSTYFCSDFASSWGMEIEATDSGLFHVVVDGECWLKAINQTSAIHLKEGDVVAFPTGGSHWISDTPESPKRPGTEVIDEILSGANPFQVGENKEEGKRITLMCGAFKYDTNIKHAFLKDLPCFIHLEAEHTPELAWLRSLVSVLSVESRQQSPGFSVIIDRLTEVLFIQLLREHIRRQASKHGYLSALADPYIGRALNLIHDDQNSQCSVESLGKNIGLSRSAFTDRFSKLVGQSPKAYLMDWRMQKAKTQLTQSNLGMFQIAESAGYSSEAAFSKAFKQVFNTPPGKFRRTTQD